jgi:hypothetical protein
MSSLLEMERGEVKVRTHRFDGVLYDVDIDSNCAGYCDPPTGNDRPCLHVGTNITTKKGLEDLFHEMLHACHWRGHEGKVEQTAKDMASLVWRLGFRFRKE